MVKQELFFNAGALLDPSSKILKPIGRDCAYAILEFTYLTPPGFEIHLHVKIVSVVEESTVGTSRDSPTTTAIVSNRLRGSFTRALLYFLKSAIYVSKKARKFMKILISILWIVILKMCCSIFQPCSLLKLVTGSLFSLLYFVTLFAKVMCFLSQT